MGFFDKIKQGLSKTRALFGDTLEEVFSNAEEIDDDFFDELEETLILALGNRHGAHDGLGVDLNAQLIEHFHGGIIHLLLAGEDIHLSGRGNLRQCGRRVRPQSAQRRDAHRF